ncbi:MAG: hypothetical protein LBH04_10945 [Tannerellaceae bacterium]|nr:hypothetical protein [Tannerellaceae bacterium]
MKKSDMFRILRRYVSAYFPVRVGIFADTGRMLCRYVSAVFKQDCLFFLILVGDCFGCAGSCGWALMGVFLRDFVDDCAYLCWIGGMVMFRRLDMWVDFFVCGVVFF